MGDQILYMALKAYPTSSLNQAKLTLTLPMLNPLCETQESALMGMGHATGDNRAQIAAEQAISSPLLEQTNIAGAVGMIVNITAPPDFMMHELDDAMGVIQDTAPEAQIIFGLVYKDELELGDEVLVTVIATGFDGVEGADYGIDDTDTYQRQTPALPNSVYQVQAEYDRVSTEHHPTDPRFRVVGGEQTPNHP